MNTLTRLLQTALLPLCALLFCNVVQAQDKDALIAQARQEALAKQYLDCLTTAQKAISQDAKNYKGYYYAAYALYQTGQLGDAETRVRQAAARASDDALPLVQKLEQAISWKRTELSEIKIGDAAMQDGLTFKAAQAYQAAWESGKLDPDVGLKAANLFSDKLNQPADAANILREIVLKYPDLPSGQTAAGLLNKLGPDLAKAAKDFYNQAQQTTGDQRKQLLQEAINADPSFTPPYFSMAEFAAEAGDSTNMYNALAQLSKRGLLTAGYLIKISAFDKYLNAVQFQRFVEDSLGPEESDKIKAFAKAQRQAPRPGSPYVNSLGMKFVPMPGTKALFCIWDTRVEDYRAFANASSDVNTKWQNPGFAQSGTDPVVDVSWNDAMAFCAWLTQKERAEGKIGAAQSYRLPSDVEWSAAVGLSELHGDSPVDKVGKIPGVYPWGTQWPPPHGAGNFVPRLGVDDFQETSPVGSFASNQYGLYDMGGNVREWCYDRPAPGVHGRRIRGSSWCIGWDTQTLLSSHYDFMLRDARLSDVGFRCVLELAVSDH